MAKKEFIECDDEVIALANEVIDEHKLDYLNGVKIKYLFVSPNISKTVVGKCIRPNAELQYFSGFDFIIELSSDTFEGLTIETRKALLWHELKHILITTDKDGNTQYKIAPHDLNDFYNIVDALGLDWLNSIKVTAASVNDLTPDMQDKIKI
jgi:predicted metallopeptidase